MTSAGGERLRWRPLNREQFTRLQRGQRLKDRRGRVWTVTAEPFQEHGLAQLVMRSGDLVRRVSERFAEDYMLLGSEADRGHAESPPESE